MTGQLDRVNSPEDLRKMTSLELEELAGEIREFLVENVSRSGGHLGPNLGVVELTIALHRVFKVGHDDIVFDTGHQSYVHKILTGRKDFQGFRTAEGLSGYPSRAESPYDIVENSHASTALAWAHGIATAKKLRGDRSWTVAVIGDGALTGGLAWEALNNISERNDVRLMIVVNDNGRSYAPTIGGLAHHLDALRTNPAYEKTLSWGKRHLQSKGRPGEFAYDLLHGMKRGLQDMVMPRGIFTDLGIKYTGPVDGHDIVALEFALTRAREFGAPVIVHTITEKGRGYRPAEENVSDLFHSIGRINPETGLPIVPSRFGWTSAFAEEIALLADQDRRIVGITAAMLEPVGLKLLQDRYPERVIDVGIAEADALTMAAGLAHGGMRPVVALYSTFLNRGFDQLLMDVALHREPVTVMLDRAGVTGSDGASHNGMWDISVCAIVPGLHLAAPRDGERLREALRDAVGRDHGPNVIRYPKGSLPEPIVALREVCEGVDVLLDSGEPDAPVRVIFVAVGALVPQTMEAARSLTGWAAGRLRVEVLNPTWILPVPSGLIDYLRSANLVVTVEDGLLDGGFGTQLRVAADSEGISADFAALGLHKVFLTTDSRDSILARSHLDAAGIVNVVQQRLCDRLG